MKFRIFIALMGVLLAGSSRARSEDHQVVVADLGPIKLQSGTLGSGEGWQLPNYTATAFGSDLLLTLAESSSLQFFVSRGPAAGFRGRHNTEVSSSNHVVNAAGQLLYIERLTWDEFRIRTIVKRGDYFGLDNRREVKAFFPDHAAPFYFEFAALFTDGQLWLCTADAVPLPVKRARTGQMLSDPWEVSHYRVVLRWFLVLGGEAKQVGMHILSSNPPINSALNLCPANGAELLTTFGDQMFWFDSKSRKVVSHLRSPAGRMFKALTLSSFPDGKQAAAVSFSRDGQIQLDRINLATRGIRDSVALPLVTSTDGDVTLSITPNREYLVTSVHYSQKQRDTGFEGTTAPYFTYDGLNLLKVTYPEEG